MVRGNRGRSGNKRIKISLLVDQPIVSTPGAFTTYNDLSNILQQRSIHIESSMAERMNVMFQICDTNHIQVQYFIVGTTSTSKGFIKKSDRCFARQTTLIAKSFVSLVERKLIWALIIYQLLQTLSTYTVICEQTS